MTSETERPRQRTVAELLAEHGDAASSSRRRRRRSPDDEPAEPAQTLAPPGGAIVAQRVASPAVPDAPPHPYFEPGDDDRREAYRAVNRAPQAPPVPREFPTDVMPRVPADRAAGPGAPPADAEVTGPIPLVAPAAADGGPPTQFSPGVVDEWAEDEWSDDAEDEWSDDAQDDWDEEPDADRAPGPRTGLQEDGDAREFLYGGDQADPADDEYPDTEPAEAKRAGPTWPAVIAQWIAGAVGGAALWVAFRYLWNSYPVVAVAAALVVTVGLVIIVRALLRNRDIRTTVFAVVVGLLLTVSPALLVLIGR
ncbi:MAG: hypothetical protein ACT4RN_04305 [Pseudonocardia sp.]